MIRVTLSDFEMNMATTVGVARNVAALTRRFTQRAESGSSAWNNHLDGACAEMSVAKAFGLYWNGSVNTFTSGGDVGDIEVRCDCRTRNMPSLKLHPKDDPHKFFVGVYGRAPTFTILGGIRARNGQLDQYAADPNGWGRAFWVPYDQLVDLTPRAIRTAGVVPMSDLEFATALEIERGSRQT